MSEQKQPISRATFARFQTLLAEREQVMAVLTRLDRQIAEKALTIRDEHGLPALTLLGVDDADDTPVMVYRVEQTSKPVA